VDSQLKDALKAFRFRKKKDQLAALIIKIDAKQLIILQEDLLEGTNYGKWRLITIRDHFRMFA
jgi:hypothetical protein